MCKCIEQTVEQLKVVMYPDAENISFANQELISGKLFSSVEAQLPGKKKPQIVQLLHSYCPMCGEKYPDKK